MFRRISSITVIACLWLFGPDAYGSCEVVADLVQAVEPTSEQVKWANSKFVDDGTSYGFDRIRFLEVDFETIMATVDANGTKSKRDPVAAETGEHNSGALVFALSPFPDREYYLMVEKVVRDTIYGTKFMNLFGVAVPSPCEVDKHNAVGGWRLHINAIDDTGEGEISTSEFLVLLGAVPNSDLVVAAEISQARLATFPPID